MLTALFILGFLVVLGLLVFVHEAGHFLLAKRAGVRVEEFAFGFPPKIWSRKKGETVYAIGAIPLGGYVKLAGENDSPSSEAAEDPRSFAAKSAGKRALILAGGVTANLVFAWLLLTIWFASAALRPPTGVLFVTAVLPDSAAAKAGLQMGDLIISADGQSVKDAEALKAITQAKQDQPLKFVLRRFGKDRTETVTLGQGDAPLGVGIEKLAEGEQPPSMWLSPWYALKAIYAVAYTTIYMLGTIIGGLFIHRQAAAEAAGQVAGPIGIFGMLSQMMSLGVFWTIRFVGLISLALAVFNLLPIPALDGGRLLFVGIEKLFGRSIKRDKIEQWAHAAGFALLLGLIILISGRDILRLVQGLG